MIALSLLIGLYNVMKNNFFSVVAFSAFLLSASSDASIIDLGVDLGSAQQYTMAAGGANSSIILGSEAEVFGSVGAYWYLSLASGAEIHGNACAQALSLGAGTAVNGSQGICGQLGADISNANIQASALANSAQSLGVIDQTTTLSATSTNHYTLDSVILNSGEFLTVNGSSTDNVIINILGNAKIGSGSGILLTGGLTSDNVLFNFANTGFSSFEFGGANISGTFLADQGAYVLGDGATLDDVRFYTNRIMSANVQVVRTSEPTDIIIDPDTDLVVQVPEPGTFALLLAGIFFLLMRTNSKIV